jgi:hypothetical protein
MRTTRLIGALACWGAASLASAAAASAQADVEVIPYFATYYAVSSLGFVNAPGEDIAFKQGSTPMGGVRIRVRVANAVSLEGSAAYGNSPLVGLFDDPTDDPDLGETGVAFSGNLLIANGRLLYRPRRSNLYLMAGAGMVRRGGNAWDKFVEATEKTAIAGLLGFGVRAAITPRLSFDVGLEAHLYSVDPDGDEELFEAKFQQDLLVTVGIPIGLIGR